MPLPMLTTRISAPRMRLDRANRAHAQSSGGVQKANDACPEAYDACPKAYDAPKQLDRSRYIPDECRDSHAGEACREATAATVRMLACPD
jgi:hypothetical protein